MIIMDRKKLEEIKRYIEELRTIKTSKNNQENKFLSIESYTCYLNNSHVITREKLLKGNKDGSAVITLPVTADKKFILAIEPRVFTNTTVDIGLPAGYIEDDEKPIIAARRELLEETGYISDNFISLGSFYQDQGCSGAYNHYFVALNCYKIKEQSLDDGEFIKYILVNYEELNYLIENNYIKGLNSIYTITKARKLIKNL